MRWRLALAAAAVASHATVLTGGFIWLDHGDLEGRAALAPPAQWLSLFTHGYARTGFYRPLTAWSFSIDSLANGPLLFHLQSLCWHAVVAVLCAIAAEELGLSRRAALLAGAIFALHPATSIVADVITYRGDALVSAALLGLIIAHARRQIALAMVCAFLAPLTKETGFVLGPLFVLALELSPARNGAQATQGLAARRESHRPLLLAELAALSAALGLRFAFAPAWRARLPPLSMEDAIGTRLASLAKSALTLIAPIDRSICDAFAIHSIATPAALAGLLVAALVIWIAVRRRGPALLLAAALLPSLDLVAAPRFWSPHYLYLALAFAAMLAAEGLDRLGPRALVVGASVAALLGAITLHDGLRFRSDGALFRAEIVAQPACREAHFYLGESLRQAGELDGAATEYTLAAASTPGLLSYVDEAAALQNLGVVRLQQARIGDAETAFRAALARVSDDDARRRLQHDLALAAAALGDDAEVARLLEPSAARTDALPESLVLLAGALHNLGRERESLDLLARVNSKGSQP